MHDESERKRLAAAINSLAATIAEIIKERVERMAEATERRLKELPAEAADPVLNKKEVAQRLHIAARTVDDWMKRGLLPYVKIGRSVRFRWSQIERYLEMAEISRRW